MDFCKIIDRLTKPYEKEDSMTKGLVLKKEGVSRIVMAQLGVDDLQVCNQCRPAICSISEDLIEIWSER